MAGTESGPIVSELQSYHLTRVIPLNRQPGYPPYQEQWEQVDIKNPASHIQDLPYDWKGFKVFIEKDNIQPVIGNYDNISSPRDEHKPLQQSESALRPRGLLSPNEPSKQERELHELTHLPYRRTCSVCGQAKGKHSPHPTIQDRRPVIPILLSCRRSNPAMRSQSSQALMFAHKCQWRS